MFIRIAALGVALLLSVAARADKAIYKHSGFALMPHTCNQLLLALHTSSLDSYFSWNAHPAMYSQRQRHGEQNKSEADKAFEYFLSEVALSITGLHTSRIQLYRGEGPLLGKWLTPSVFSLSNAASKAWSTLTKSSFLKVQKKILFTSYIDVRDIDWTYQIGSYDSIPRTGTLTKRKFYCRWQMFLPKRTQLTNVHQLQIPFVIDNCQHKVATAFSVSLGKRKYTHQATHTRMSSDALEYAQILAHEKGFKWPTQWSYPLAQGVISLSSPTTDSLRLHPPTQAELQFVSVYSNELLSIDLLKK